jgi:hypothetical protein
MSDKSTEFIGEFINIYRQSPALWKIKSKIYANKKLKGEGYSKLLQFYQTFDNSATIDCKKKN